MLLIDTNIYSGLAKGDVQLVNLVKTVNEIGIPLPVIAELRYGFAKGAQAERNEQSLLKFLLQPQISIVSPTLETSVFYAQIQLICSQKGKTLSHNDIWIAALARENGCRLATFDKDFAVLRDLFGDDLILL